MTKSQGFATSTRRPTNTLARGGMRRKGGGEDDIDESEEANQDAGDQDTDWGSERGRGPHHRAATLGRNASAPRAASPGTDGGSSGRKHRAPSPGSPGSGASPSKTRGRGNGGGDEDEALSRTFTTAV